MNEMPTIIADLIARHLNDDLSDEDRRRLDEWVQQSDDNRRFFQQLTDEQFVAATMMEYETSKEIVYKKIKDAVEFGEQKKKNALILRLSPRKLTAVAASILILAGSLFWWNAGRKEVPQVQSVAVSAVDGNPASEGAILKLADGEEIVLDDAKDGNVTTQGSTQVSKQGGLLTYHSNGVGDEVLYNTLSTPKGKIYKLELPDGSKIWLNAASSIRFPTAFTGWERRVEITGEVYLEVKRDEEVPFRVTVNERATIDVLGTAFNVNAYSNETLIRTTLLSGSVRIKAWEREQRGNSVVLKPGQQAQVKNASALQTSDQSAAITVVQNVDVGNVMGWKEGYFNLDNLTFAELMREVERWYDVEVVYEKGIPAKALFGKVNRDLTLSDFMDGLKYWGVHFRLDGRKLIVTGSK